MTETLASVTVTPRRATYVKARYGREWGTKHARYTTSIKEVASRNVQDLFIPDPDHGTYWDLLSLHVYDLIEITLEDGTVLQSAPQDEQEVQISVDGEHVRQNSKGEDHYERYGWHRAPKLKEGPFLVIPKWSHFPKAA